MPATGSPLILFDLHPRSAATIFGDTIQARFERLSRLIGVTEGASEKLPARVVEEALPEAERRWRSLRAGAHAPGTRL